MTYEEYQYLLQQQAMLQQQQQYLQAMLLGTPQHLTAQRAMYQNQLDYVNNSLSGLQAPLAAYQDPMLNPFAGSDSQVMDITPTGPGSGAFADVNAGTVTDANVGNGGAVAGGAVSGDGSVTTGTVQQGNAVTGSQTAPTGPTGDGGNTAPGAGAGDAGQSAIVEGLQRNSPMDFNKGAGGMLTGGPAGRTVANSATGIVQRSALTPLTAQQAKLGIVGKKPGMLSV